MHCKLQPGIACHTVVCTNQNIESGVCDCCQGLPVLCQNRPADGLCLSSLDTSKHPLASACCTHIH